MADEPTKTQETQELDSLRAKLKELEEKNAALAEENKGKLIVAKRVQAERDKLHEDFTKLQTETNQFINDMQTRPGYYAEKLSQAARAIGQSSGASSNGNGDDEITDPHVKKLMATVGSLTQELDKSKKVIAAMYQEQQKAKEDIHGERKLRVGERFERSFNERFKDVKWKNDTQKERAKLLYESELKLDSDDKPVTEDSARDQIMDYMNLTVEKPETAAQQVARLNIPEGFLVSEAGVGGEPAPELKAEELGKDEFIAQISKRNVALLNMADQAEQGMESSTAVS